MYDNKIGHRITRRRYKYPPAIEIVSFPSTMVIFHSFWMFTRGYIDHTWLLHSGVEDVPSSRTNPTLKKKTCLATWDLCGNCSFFLESDPTMWGPYHHNSVPWNRPGSFWWSPPGCCPDKLGTLRCHGHGVLEILCKWRLLDGGLMENGPQKSMIFLIKPYKTSIQFGDFHQPAMFQHHKAYSSKWYQWKKSGIWIRQLASN